ncbi:PREDICTED: alpha-protein kinase 1 [Drosophila arizonae]|uniref:Alpha-protein kinase 1 n=1 Tax=Drosophila arizonae TaxID=7263 RepID=A0ABM1P745_DROAR|nr:PREDICTED: alpha-protein kinase 1 [Drosophila arizonae]XP_017863031.1 PREDICTED: alpha-protein kinase 1 [Drosophila arizonae]
MHFWIDKRSQQCGFGRSRVAASLSHAGGGLSYGHPPRRSKSSSNSVNNVAGSSGSSGSHNQALASVHRGPAPYGGDCQSSGAGTSRQSAHYASSNNNAHASVQQQHQQLLHHSSNNNNSNVGMATTTTASNNNNPSGTASSAAVLTGSGTIVPLVAHGSHYHQHSSTRYQPRPQHHHQQQLQQLQHQHQLQQQHQQQQQHHYSYSYHHPQFGNMAVPVRQYDQQHQHQHQHQQQQQQQQHHQHQQHAGVYADDAYSAYHHHHSSSSNSNSCNNTNNSRYVTPRRHNSSSNMRHATVTAAAAATTTASVPATATPIPPTQTQTGVQSNQLQQQHHALLQHADSQLLPSHLKCGMCASLVLASVFVAGAKFYFDHQGTGLEVLIFCAFSATFFLAACMVSLCRIPKGLLPSSSSGGRGGSNSRSDARAVCHSRGGNATSCMLELNDVRYLDERQVEVSPETAAAAASGPPPYHIAILLPEQTPTALGKQVPLDESPPPSYDKILV